jgi:anti-sigma B factor antagonist
LISFTAPARPEPLSDEEENNVALKMTNREVDGVSVVALDGRIVLGEESNALREKVKGLIASGKKKIILNMDNVTFIDSAGLGTLVAAHHSAKSQGAGLRLCHLGSKFQEVLQITKLMTVFDVYKTEAEAVASFSK